MERGWRVGPEGKSDNQGRDEVGCLVYCRGGVQDLGIEFVRTAIISDQLVECGIIATDQSVAAKLIAMD